MTTQIERADLRRGSVAQEFLELMDLFVRGEGAMTDGSGLSEDVRHRLVPALLERADSSVLLARREERAVGFAVCVEGFSTFAARPVLNLHDMMVHPDHRRSGGGRALLSAVEERARELGCCKLTLEVLSGNDVAKALYRSYGFEGYSLDPQNGTALFWQKKL